MARRLLIVLATLAFARTASADPVDEVQVRGAKPPAEGETTIGEGEIRQVPGAFGDAFRVIEALPGVTPIVSGLPFFFVRGAPPGDNGYYIDGVRVPLLFHIGFGPSVVHPALVQRVDFWPGGAPARFGRSLGGVLSGETRAPANELHGEANLRLFDAGGLVEAPFGCDDRGDCRGAALVAGRYSYTALLVSLFAPDTSLDYWDYQGRVAWRLDAHDTISAFVFGSHDFLGDKRSDGTEHTVFASQFHRVDLRFDRDLPAHGHLRAAVTLGHDSTETEDVSGVRDRMIAARLSLEQPAGDDVLFRAGVDSNLDHYDLSGDDARSQDNLYPPRNDVVAGAWADAVIHATSRWQVTPGLRADLFESARSLASDTPSSQRRNTNAAIPSIDPRLLSRLRLSSAVTLVSTFGVTHQAPSFFIPVPGLQLGRLADGLQTGVQTSQGVEVALPEGFTLAPTVFYHHYLGLSDYGTTCIGDTSADTESTSSCIDRRVRGRTIGAELLLRRSLTKRLSGWLSYTLSRTTRATQVTSLIRRGPYAEIPGDFDRTHVLSAIGAYDLGRRWRAGLRFFFYTGRPYSQHAFGLPIPPYDDERFPAFYRFDARLEKEWTLGKSGRVALVFEWLNLNLAKEVTGLKCTAPSGPSATSGRSVGDARDGKLSPEQLDQCSFEEIGPVTIPSVGVEGQF